MTYLIPPEYYYEPKVENGILVNKDKLYHNINFRIYADECDLCTKLLTEEERKEFSPALVSQLMNSTKLIAIRCTLRPEGQVDYSGIGWPYLSKGEDVRLFHDNMIQYECASATNWLFISRLQVAVS